MSNALERLKAGARKFRAEQNVLMQLAHLKTHPSVAGAMARGKLTVSGWVYEIGSGEMRIAEGESRQFIRNES